MLVTRHNRFLLAVVLSGSCLTGLALLAAVSSVTVTITVDASNMADHVDRVRGEILTNHLAAGKGYPIVRVFQNAGMAPPRMDDGSLDQKALEKLLARQEISIVQWDAEKKQGRIESVAKDGQDLRTKFLGLADEKIVTLKTVVPARLGAVVALQNDALSFTFDRGLQIETTDPLFGRKLPPIELKSVTISPKALSYEARSATGEKTWKFVLELR
jgi:hypothetical protein